MCFGVGGWWLGGWWLGGWWLGGWGRDDWWLAHGWWLGEKMLGPGVAFLYLVHMDACKLTVAHILSFRDNFQIADPLPTLS